MKKFSYYFCLLLVFIASCKHDDPNMVVTKKYIESKVSKIRSVENAGIDHNNILAIAFNDIRDNNRLVGANKSNFREILKNILWSATKKYYTSIGYSLSDLQNDSLAYNQHYSEFSISLNNYTKDSSLTNYRPEGYSPQLEAYTRGLDSICAICSTPNQFNEISSSYYANCMRKLSAIDQNYFEGSYNICTSSFKYWYENKSAWDSVVSHQTGVAARGTPIHETIGADQRWFSIGGGVAWSALCSGLTGIGDICGWW